MTLASPQSLASCPRDKRCLGVSVTLLQSSSAAAGLDIHLSSRRVSHDCPFLPVVFRG